MEKENWTTEEYEAYFDSLVADMDDVSCEEILEGVKRANRRELR